MHSKNLLQCMKRYRCLVCSRQFSAFRKCSFRQFPATPKIHTSIYLFFALPSPQSRDLLSLLWPLLQLTVYIYLNGRLSSVSILVLFFLTPRFIQWKIMTCWILVLTTAWAGVYLNRRLDCHLSILALFFPTASFFLLCPLFAPHWGCFLGDLRAGPDQYHAHGQTSLIEMSLQHHHPNSHFHLII